MSSLSALLPKVPGSGGGSGEINRRSEFQTASAGQTTFDLQDISYRPGYTDLLIRINGVTQERSARIYTESSPQRVVLSSPLEDQDQVDFSVLRFA